jgi:hypothetical protein
MPMEKNAASSAHTLLKNGAAVCRSRLKIVIDVADMFRSSEVSAKMRSFQVVLIDRNED